MEQRMRLDKPLKRYLIIALVLPLLIVASLPFWPLYLRHLFEPKADISYEEAVNLLYSGQVMRSGQSHSLRVFLDLKNGTSLVAIEPVIDAIWRAWEQCGDPCKDTTFWTE